MLSGPRKPLRYAVFISGSGSTLQSLLEMQHQFEIALVISNQAKALGLLKAKRFGKTTLVFPNPVDFKKIHLALKDQHIDRIVLAGFMKMIPAEFVEMWKDRIVNIHPSLLPLYPGLDSGLRSWKDQSEMGVSIHNVTAGMDEGRVFLKQISLNGEDVKRTSFESSEIFLRRTEQHLLRELATRWNQ